MTWERELLDLFEDLEHQAEGLALTDRDAEVAELARSEYAEIDLAARVHASVGQPVEQGRVGRQHHHERRRRGGPGEVRQQSLRLLGQRDGDVVPDEGALGRLLLEVSLLDSAYQRFGRSEEDALANAAKRYRVDTEKLAKAVAQEFAVKHKKQERKTAKKKVVA